MRKIVTSSKIGIVLAGLAAFSVPLLTPTPAAAWWHHGYHAWHPGWGGHPGWGWHRGWGWHAGWGWRPYGWHAPGVIVAPPAIAYARPPVVSGPAWVPAHWNGPYWVAGHWG